MVRGGHGTFVQSRSWLKLYYAGMYLCSQVQKDKMLVQKENQASFWDKTL